MNVMKIGAKSNNQVKAVACNGNGELIVEKRWKATVNEVYKAQPTTDGSTYAEFDLNNVKAGVISLRFANSTGVPVKVTLMSDVLSTESPLCDLDGAVYETTIPAIGSKYFCLTPKEWNILNYLASLKLKIVAAETITGSGNFFVEIIHKH